MPQEFLDRADVVTRLQKVSRKGMAKGVGRGRLDDPGRRNGLFDGPLQVLLESVMAADDAAAGIGTLSPCGKNPKPPPLFASVRLLSLQCVRQGNARRVPVPVRFPK